MAAGSVAQEPSASSSRRSSKALRFRFGLALALSLAAFTAPPAQATETPVAAYSFDEGEGAVANDAFGSNDGTVEGATWVGGKYGTALRFDAEDEALVSIPDDPDLQLTEAFTLEAWVRPQYAQHWQPIITKETEGFFSYQLYAGGEASGRAEAYTAKAAWEYTGVAAPEPLQARTWTHLALTCDGEDLKLYEDGELIDAAEECDVQSSSGDLLIGGNEVFGEYLNGLIDEVRLYDRALGAEEIADDMATAIETPPSQDPIAAYSFDEAQGETANDSFGSNDGTVEGAEWVGGKYGTALYFDNEDEAAVTITHSPELELSGAFTLEAWVRPDHSQYWLPVIAKQTEGFFGYALYGAGEAQGAPEGYVANHDWEFAEAGGEAVDPRAWTHLALSCDGKTLRLYVDGELADTGGACSSQPSEGVLQIGANEVFGEWFNGTIDEVRIYNRALGVEEIETDRDTAIQTPPSEDPIAAYSFDEGEGELAEDAARDHDGTVDGAEWVVGGKFGDALRFDGEDDLVEVADASDLQLSGDFTLEAWVKPSESQSWGPIVNKETSGFIGYQLYAGGETPGVAEGNVAQRDWELATVAGPEALPTEAWSHLALVCDGEHLRLFENGELADTGAACSAQASDGPLMIGGNDVFGEHFEGLIDEVRVYDRALEAEEIASDEATPIGWGPAPEPTMALSFDENGGGTAADSVGENDATIHGASWTASGRYGSALELDGVNDYVSVPDSDELDFAKGFTLEAWVYPEEVGTETVVFSKENSSGAGFGYQLLAEGGEEVPAGRIASGEATEEVVGSGPLPEEQWSHVALTSGARGMRLYVNGKQVGSAEPFWGGISVGDLNIGGRGSSGKNFKGKVDEVRTYDNPLEVRPILDSLNQPVKPKPAGVVFLGKGTSEGPNELWGARANGNFGFLISAASSGGLQFSDPALSPNGSQVAVAYGNKIGVVDVITGELTTVYDGSAKGGEASHPQWSPGEERLIFLADVSAKSKEALRGQVYTVHPDGSGLSPVTIGLPSGQTRVRDISYSPLGNQIVFVGFNDEAKEGHVYVANADGSGADSIYTDPESWFWPTSLRHTAFSPDGGSVVFGKSGDPIDLQVHVIGSAGGGHRQLTHVATEPGANDGPTWFPGGDAIAFTNYEYKELNSLQVKVTDPSGHQSKDLFEGFYATWAPSYRQSVQYRATVENRLLAKYAPELRYDQQEEFKADSAAMITDNWGEEEEGLWGNGEGSPYGNYLLDADDTEPFPDGEYLAASDPNVAENVGLQLKIGALGGTYPGGQEADSNDWIDENNNDEAKHAQELEAWGYADRIYGYAASDTQGRLWLEYWFFYYYNSDISGFGQGSHEGDWEMIQVGLDHELQPQQVVLAQHAAQGLCEWSDLEKNLLGSPVVYAAVKSHASYPRPGTWDLPDTELADDYANGDGFAIQPSLQIVTDSRPSWIDWPGHWGNSRAEEPLESESPAGPKFHEQWGDPGKFAVEADGCFERWHEPSSLRGGSTEEAPQAPTLLSAVKVEGGVNLRYGLEGVTGGRWPRVAFSIDDAGDNVGPITTVIRHPRSLGRLRLPYDYEPGSELAIFASTITKDARSEVAKKEVLEKEK
jgi:Tol biopolymer transport system component